MAAPMVWVPSFFSQYGKMTTETEWRRQWKPDLNACPWQTFQVEDKAYHIKYFEPRSEKKNDNRNGMAATMETRFECMSVANFPSGRKGQPYKVFEPASGKRMTTETEWRRQWKPDLNACPWQTFQVEEKAYHVKYLFTQDSYKFLISDLNNFWYEEIADTVLMKRVKKLNPAIEAPLTRILDQIQTALEKTQEDANTSLKVTLKRGADEDQPKLLLSINSELAGMPFSWNFQCQPATSEMGSEHLIMPLMAMVVELIRQKEELVKLLQNKDKEIEDYKAQGVKTSRKHIETPAFVETAFEMNMLTSKEFEKRQEDFTNRTFGQKGQDLYRQIMTKQAWINRSPLKGSSDDDSLMDDLSETSNRKSSTGQSWGNSRLPPSLQQSKSPQKSPQKSPNKNTSPSKSPKSSPTSDVSAAQDSELLRRQALERRLEAEEAKKKEKSKKKKKIGF